MDKNEVEEKLRKVANFAQDMGFNVGRVRLSIEVQAVDLVADPVPRVLKSIWTPSIDLEVEVT